MAERRNIQRARTLRTGKILFNLKSSVIDCTVRNLSSTGALLQVASAVGIPPRFELLLEGESVTHQCRLAWQMDRRVGVFFEQPRASDVRSKPAGAAHTRPKLRAVPREPQVARTNVPAAALSSEQLAALHAGLHEADFGVLLLDASLRAQFVNRAYRRIWRMPDEVADSHPHFSNIVQFGRTTRAFDVPLSEVDAHVARRLQYVTDGEGPPFDVRLADGEVIRVKCQVLPNGGRMLTYHSITDLVRNAEELEHLATTDGLTGLANRRHFFECADLEWGRFERYERPLSVLLLDIDHFKAVNDRHGHHIGDQALMQVAELCRRGKRNSDVVGRIGGEEFSILLPETDLLQAEHAAERLREEVATAVCVADGIKISLSASLGVATANRGMGGVGALMKAADEALYRAKAGGRNRTSTALHPTAVPSVAAG